MKYSSALLFLILMSCNSSSGEWKSVSAIDLGEITPIGLTALNGELWISDGDHNQVVQLNTNGKIVKTFSDFERPMHLDTDGRALFIPEYGSDKIVKLEAGEKNVLIIPDSLDAPAGIAIYQEEMAIADFYNHRILYFDGNEWISFGKKGKMSGELDYPTDVSIGPEYIFVADAYNNRIQVFDKKGNSRQIIGAEEKMNAATGIFVTTEEIFITDFENDRVLSFKHDGTLKQIFSEGINKPTDVLVSDKILYIANYKGKNILTFSK